MVVQYKCGVRIGHLQSTRLPRWSEEIVFINLILKLIDN